MPYESALYDMKVLPSAEASFPTRKFVHARVGTVMATDMIDKRIFFIVCMFFNYTALNDISRHFTECVNAPTEIKSTPHSA